MLLGCTAKDLRNAPIAEDVLNAKVYKKPVWHQGSPGKVLQVMQVGQALQYNLCQEACMSMVKHTWLSEAEIVHRRIAIGVIRLRPKQAMQSRHALAERTEQILCSATCEERLWLTWSFCLVCAFSEEENDDTAQQGFLRLKEHVLHSAEGYVHFIVHSHAHLHECGDPSGNCIQQQYQELFMHV